MTGAAPTVYPVSKHYQALGCWEIAIIPHLSIVNPPKPKIAVFLGLSGTGFRAILISSHLSPAAIRSPRLQISYLPISPQNYPLLHMDSFLGCGSIVNVPASDCVQPLRVIGRVTTADTATVKGLVGSIGTLSPIDQDFIRNLPP